MAITTTRRSSPTRIQDISPPPSRARTASASSDTGSTPRRWGILGVLGIAQLMVVLDATIVNVALPSAQTALRFSSADRQWVITAYALAFGSLLLFGGRLSDRWGHRRTLLVGLTGFAAASTVGGAATSFTMLIAARGLQGAFAAVLAPACLSLLTTTFVEPRERSRAFGVFGAVSGTGAAVGLLLGGVLTQYLDWRWCLYVNDMFAAGAVLGALVLVRASAHPATQTARQRLDLRGVAASAMSMTALVVGAAQAGTSGWTSAAAVVPLVAGVLLLVAFWYVERHATHPLLPLTILRSRRRTGALLATAVTGAGMLGVFLFLTYFLQGELGLSPVQTGLAFLPMIGAITVTSTLVAPPLLARHGPRAPILVGAVVGAVAFVWLSQLHDASSYVALLLPATTLLGLALGMVFGTATATATANVDTENSGVASAMVNTAQQVGGALGTALLTTVAAAAGPHASPTLGYDHAFVVTATAFAALALLSVVLLRPQPRTVAPPPPRGSSNAATPRAANATAT